jgi:hypothetical protein
MNRVRSLPIECFGCIQLFQAGALDLLLNVAQSCRGLPSVVECLRRSAARAQFLHVTLADCKLVAAA